MVHAKRGWREKDRGDKKPQNGMIKNRETCKMEGHQDGSGAKYKRWKRRYMTESTHKDDQGWYLNGRGWRRVISGKGYA